MEVQCTGQRVVVVLMSAPLSPRSVGGELRNAWSSGRTINTSGWISEGKRPHPTTYMSCPTVLLHMFTAMKDEEDEFCVFRLVVRRPQ